MTEFKRAGLSGKIRYDTSTNGDLIVQVEERVIKNNVYEYMWRNAHEEDINVSNHQLKRDIGDGSIILTANRSVEEPWRIDRLNQVVGWLLCNIARNKGYNQMHQISDSLHSLHDHKGFMTVTWKHEVTADEKYYITEAWHGPVGDGPGLPIEHKIIEEIKK